MGGFDVFMAALANPSEDMVAMAWDLFGLAWVLVGFSVAMIFVRRLLRSV